MRYVYLGLSFLALVAAIATAREVRPASVIWRLNLQYKHLVAIADYLQEYRRETGRYPANDEGLLAVKPLVRDIEARVWSSRRGWLWNCRVSEAGVLSLWGEPLIYENRNGVDPGRFADSGATDSEDSDYSIKVDEGIYVWSIGARQEYERYMVSHRRIRAVWIGLWALSAICIVLFIVTAVRSGIRSGSGAFRVVWAVIWPPGLGLVILAVLFPIFIGPTCYAIAYYRSRTPELTRDYLALMAKYHERGIIGDEAYRKIVEAMKKPPE